jgi:hypothetical protein
MELRALIIQACNVINEDMCCRVTNSIAVLVEEVAKCNVGHSEHLIRRGYISMQWSSFLCVSF